MKTLPLLITAVVTLTASNASVANEPQLKEFSEGIKLVSSGSRPLLEMPVPDRVYSTITQWNLADVRVFNANGEAVPHAFCNTAPSAATSTLVETPVFSVDDQRPASATPGNITLHTRDGTILTVQSASDKNNQYAFRTHASYILDVRKIDSQIASIEVDWSLPSGASETRVNILSSTDLAHWQSLVTNASLVRAVANDQRTLELRRVPLPVNRYHYLRIEPIGDVLNINSAKVESIIPSAALQPTWYSAGAPRGADDPHELRYINSRRAPVSMLRITPHIENSSLHVTVQSRDREEHAWQTQWTGEVFDIHTDNQSRHTSDIAIGSVAAGEWRLLFTDSAEPPASAPSFEFGYIPTQLRFLAQGTGPFTLAYGNARVTTSNARQCDDLLSSINSTDKQQLIGTAVADSTQLLAGKDALVIKKTIPTRTLLLWGILLIGAAVIMKMALSMLKNSKHKESE